MTNLSLRQNRRNTPARIAMWDPFEDFRALWSWDPFDALQRPAAGLSRPHVEFAPSFDVLERDDHFILKADLPGVREEDLDVSVMDNQLTVSGTRHAEERREEEHYYMYERAYGDFSRTFTLPQQASTEDIEAVLENGELLVTVPKRAEAVPRKIPLGERIKRKLGTE